MEILGAILAIPLIAIVLCATIGGFFAIIGGIISWVVEIIWDIFN